MDRKGDVRLDFITKLIWKAVLLLVFSISILEDGFLMSLYFTDYFKENSRTIYGNIFWRGCRNLGKFDWRGTANLLNFQ